MNSDEGNNNDGIDYGRMMLKRKKEGSDGRGVCQGMVAICMTRILD